MRNIIILFCCIFSFTHSGFSQIGQEEWVQRVNGPANGNDHAHDIETDPAGNVYVTGWIETASGNPDCYTAKYSPAGIQLWSKIYTGSSNGIDYGYTIAVDSDGNAYVGGFGDGGTGLWDAFIIKYNTNGDTLWTARWRSPLTGYSSYIYSITVDNSGNVLTTGFTSDGFTGGAFLTLKYNPAGVLQWAKTYKGPGVSIDYGNCIAADNSGNAYVTGWSGGTNNMHDYTTIKYSPAGDTLWVRRYNGSADGNDYAYWLDLDAAGNIYVTGQSEETGSDNDITTIKYSSDGNTLWIKKYDGPANGYDAGQAIVVDAAGNSYITGNHTTVGGLDCVTLKHDPDGNLLWTRSYNGPGNSGDVLITIAMDNALNVYVSGFVASTGANDIVTIKYDSSGAEKWVQLYDGSGGYDGSYAVTVDASQNVYVAGYSIGNGTDYDYTVIKYSEGMSVSQYGTGIPSRFELAQNYPNPFNPETKINFNLPFNGRINMRVFDMTGKEVATLISGTYTAGYYTVTFNAGNISSGIYFYRLEVDGVNPAQPNGESQRFVEIKKMLLVK